MLAGCLLVAHIDFNACRNAPQVHTILEGRRQFHPNWPTRVAPRRLIRRRRRGQPASQPLAQPARTIKSCCNYLLPPGRFAPALNDWRAGTKAPPGTKAEPRRRHNGHDREIKKGDFYELSSLVTQTKGAGG